MRWKLQFFIHSKRWGRDSLSISRLCKRHQCPLDSHHRNKHRLKLYNLWMIDFLFYFIITFFCEVLALVVVPIISVAVRYFGRYLRELSHATQAAAAVAASIAEVCLILLNFINFWLTFCMNC